MRDDDDDDIVCCLIRQAELQTKIYEYNGALLNYGKALEIYLKHEDILHSNVTSIYRQVAVIYLRHKHDYHLALKYQLLKHKNTLMTCTPDFGNENFYIEQKKKHTAESHLELAEIYIALKQYDLATEHLRTAMKINDERSSKYTIDISAACYEIFADVYLALNQTELATEHLRIAMELYKELKQQHIQAPGEFRHLMYEPKELIESDEIKIKCIEEKVNNRSSIVFKNCPISFVSQQ
ncbi:unnamed protein product [Rotaria sp. Silwood2]|nr:unnamed protein product [Rotaria sp. Silwood2]CAF4452198.1 unnamed protein product [Rotaria sp. Silwood2]